MMNHQVKLLRFSNHLCWLVIGHKPDHHTYRNSTLTRWIGTSRSSIERVNSSFHSGLQLFVTTRDFNFCINLQDVKRKEGKSAAKIL